MKIRNLMVTATLLVTAGAMAQNQDCAFFFPNQEGEQITLIATLLMVNLLIS